ncbi:PorV/PorQ family protein [Elusimicrobiota bacterium]
MLKKLLSSLILLPIILFSIESYLFSAFSRDYAGTSTAQFLKLGAGARAGGMGDVYVAIADDANAIYWNPAGLRQVEDQSLSFMHMSWLADTSYDWFAFASDFREFGTLGIGIQYLSYGNITYTDTIGASRGTFSPSDMSGTLSYARDIGRFAVGINGKYISSIIRESASAFAMDAGVLYKMPDQKLSFGGVIENVGTGMKFITEEAPLPLNIKLGGAYYSNNNLLVGMDITIPNDNDIYFGLGCEYKMDYFTTRAGYNTRTKDIGGMAGLSAGVGFVYEDFEIDYAYQPYDYLGTAHRISLTWNSFGESKKTNKQSINFCTEYKIFSPNNDRIRDVIVFSRVEEKTMDVKKWKLEIQNPKRHVVKEISGEGEIPGILSWNAKIGKNDKIDEGEYRYIFRSNKQNKTYGSFIIDLTAPEIEAGLVGDSGDLSVTVKDNSGIEKWKIEIINDKGSVINSVEYSSDDTKIWNISNYLTENDFTVRIVVLDKVGNKGTKDVAIRGLKSRIDK